MPALRIAPQKVAWIILKLRAYEAKVSPHDLGEEAADEEDAGAIENRRHDPDLRELTAFISALNEDEQTDLVALLWLGRDSYELEEWDDAVAASASDRPARTASYVTGMPMSPDFLAEGLAKFGVDVAELESDVVSET